MNLHLMAYRWFGADGWCVRGMTKGSWRTWAGAANILVVCDDELFELVSKFITNGLREENLPCVAR